MKRAAKRPKWRNAIRFVLLSLAPTALLAKPGRANDPFETIIKPVMREYCVRCHGGDEVEGDVNLVKLDSAALSTHPEMIETFIDVLDLGEMPPEDEPQPSAKDRAKVVVELKKMLRTAISNAALSKRTPIRRMNRFQYSNAVDDLFQLKRVVFTLPERMMREHRNYFQPASGKMAPVVHVGSRPLGKSQLIEPRLAGVTPFPQDLRAEHGFDNRGDHLSLSPLLLESFMRLSQSIVNSPDFGPKTVGIWPTFFAEPPADANARQVVRDRLKPLLRKAFRIEVDKATLTRYADFAMHRIENDDSFTEAMKATASAVIASPRFLYLYASRQDAADPIDNFELAARLSFFLWGSLPDDTLLDLASDGTLGNPKVLEQQVERMLTDKKLKRFCDSFPSQWLQLERIISSVPNRERFADFYFSKYRTSMHMMLEPLLVFETIVIEDRSILQLIDSDFSYRSARLDRLYYGNNAKLNDRQNPVTALPFTRVPVKDRREGGVITTAAIMTMTSGTERTKPITRGAWLATVIFNSPPPPPPADVPPLDEQPPDDEKNLTLRERLVLHRERASCAGCHERIDPLGFALENYGPTGKWRERYENDRDIETQGRLFGEHPYGDIAGFKDAILAEKDRFTRGFASHLLSFSLAREVTTADTIELDKIASATANDGYRMKALIKHIVLSNAFRK